jgi:hypothetical protein
MAADPAAFEQLFASRGGFATAYRKLVALAKAMLVTYGGDSASRVCLRQLDPEEIVNAAFERYFDEGAEGEEEVYLLLRRHIRNYVRSLAKSVQQARTVRVDGNKDQAMAYRQATDPTEMSTVDRLLVVDDFDFCQKVIFRVLGDSKADAEVCSICEAIIAGFRDYADICDFAKMSQPAFDAAFKRLKRRFGHACDAVEKEDKE